MVVEARLGGLGKLEIGIEVGTNRCALAENSVLSALFILEILLLINDLYAMLVLLLRWRIANIRKVAVHRHY